MKMQSFADFNSKSSKLCIHSLCIHNNPYIFKTLYLNIPSLVFITIV